MEHRRLCLIKTLLQYLPRETEENPVRITVAPTDIRYESIWSASLQCYRYISLLSDDAFSYMLYATEHKHECRTVQNVEGNCLGLSKAVFEQFSWNY